MSISRPARCLFSNPPVPAMASRTRCRHFHSTPSLLQRRKPRHANIKAADMGLIENRPPRPPASELFRPYSEEEKAQLAKRYTPEQIRAIEAGEGAISIEDLDTQGIIRTDPGSVQYLDDFRHYRSVIDKKPPDNTPVDPNARFMTPDEMSTSFRTYYDKLDKENPPPPPPKDEEQIPEFDPTRLNFFRADYDSPRYMGTNGPIPSGPNLLAPSIPKTFGEIDSSGGGETFVPIKPHPKDPNGRFDVLRKQTGLSMDDILALKPKILVENQVSNQTRLGKVQSVYCLAIAGNRNGVLGIGQAKGQNPEATQALAQVAAIRSMKPIPRYEDRTIYGDVEAKVSAVTVKLMTRPPGFGLRCQSLIFEMGRAAGIHDLSARVPRARNKMNVVKATYKALMSQKIPDEIARGRGKKLVDVRKVYYGGLV